MTIECCADIIAFYQGKLVIIERLSTPQGLALPGGRLDEGESLEECAIREFREETGAELTNSRQFRTYSDPGRDPRGQKVSTVYVGEARGKFRDEPYKTRVMLMELSELPKRKSEFVFDHYQIMQDYLASSESFIYRRRVMA